MVQQGHFEVELVRTFSGDNEGNDNKPSFREHLNPRDKKTYVEVDMGQDYFIGLRKTRTVAEEDCDGLICCLYVDGKDLGYETFYHSWEVHHKQQLSGLWSFDGITSTERALTFQKSRRGGPEKASTAAVALHSALGSVTVQVFMGHSTGKLVPRHPCEHDPFSLPSFTKNKTVPRMKYLRSEEGTSETQWTPSDPKYMEDYQKGQFLYSVTLHYGDASDLLKIGLFDDSGATRALSEQQRALNAENKARIVLEKMMGEIDMICDDDVESPDDDDDDDGVVEDLFSSMDME